MGAFFKTTFDDPDAPVVVSRRHLDLAWAAGFLDGEGCFTLTAMSGPTHPSQRALHVSASQARVEPLLKLQRLFGGRVASRRQTHSGNTIHYWVLSSSAESIKAFLPQVMPYLVVKRREAELLLEFAQTIRRRGRPKAGTLNHTALAEVAIRERIISEFKAIRGEMGSEKPVIANSG